jgi:hypothetical protein
MSTSTVPSDFPIKTEVLTSGEVNGIPWVSARAPLYDAVNGYVRLPDGHPWLEVDYLYEIENGIPWGEITYGKGNWIGFDSLHSGQYWPGEQKYKTTAYPDDTLMTEEMVIGWTRQLAQEAHDYVANGTYSI